MKRMGRGIRVYLGLFILLLISFVFVQFVSAVPSVFKKGLTIYNPEKSYVGFTIYCKPSLNKIIVLDMEGREFHEWTTPDPYLTFCGLGKPLDNGNILAFVKARDMSKSLIQMDWDSNIMWQYSSKEIQNFHHDFHRISNKNTLILGSVYKNAPYIIPGQIKDDIIIEVDEESNIIWQWSTVDHFDQLGFSEQSRNLIYQKDQADVFHTNSIQSLPHTSISDMDSRFMEGNILVSQRNTNTIFVIDRRTGNVVWTRSKSIGQHHARMIPNGLDVAGNIILFDNGGPAGYPTQARLFSLVAEINPLHPAPAVWEYNGNMNNNSILRSFCSPFMGSAQRLPNGNTLITESEWGRIFEVTKEGETVWEYVNPYFSKGEESSNKVYRAYRVAPTWPNGPVGPSGQFIW
jgi:hypothetical protein